MSTVRCSWFEQRYMVCTYNDIAICTLCGNGPRSVLATQGQFLSTSPIPYQLSTQSAAQAPIPVKLSNPTTFSTLLVAL